MAQNGNGDEKRAKLIGSVVAAVVTALAGGGAIGYQMHGGSEARAATGERPVTRAEFEEVRAHGIATEKQLMAFVVEVRVGLNTVVTGQESQTKAFGRVEAELAEMRKARR